MRVALQVLAACLLMTLPASAATPAGQCATAKLKVAGKKAAAKLKCYASAIKGDHPVDLACLAKAEQKFAADFAKAEAKGGCNRVGDTTIVEGDVDSCVSTLSADQPGSPGSRWTPLIARSWTVRAGSETYRCRRIQLQSDLYVTGFHSVSPPGVFRTIVTVSPSTATPFGDYDCTPGNVDQHLIYESGIGTDDLNFPLGAGVHLHAGDYLNMNVLLEGDPIEDLEGTSGVLVRTGSASDVINDTELTLVGTFNISVPSNGQPYIAQGGCTWTADAQVIALWPHLLTTGTHAKLVFTPQSSMTSLTPLDIPYTVAQQPIHPASFALHPGDIVSALCTYVNDTGTTLTYGDSAFAEQCFVGLYLYGIDPPAPMFACTSS